MVEPQLLFHDIAPGVTAFSTTRHGGFSRGNYAELNINQHCGDAPEATEKNLSLLCSTLNINPGRVVMPHQTHGTETRQIAEEFFGLPQSTRRMLLEGVDAVMTDVSEACVGVSTADCIPIILYDTAHRACCAVHAGWRGTAGRIAQKAVAAMCHAYSTLPRQLRAVIGPGISADAFEVGDEVYGQFAAAGFDMGRISHRTDKWHIDLWECNRLQLLEAGLEPASVAVAGICTYNNADDFFSARRLGATSGRIFTGIIIRQGQ